MLGHAVELARSFAEGTASTTVMRGPPASATVFQPIPKALPARSLMRRGAESLSAEQRPELREVVLDPERRAELEPEFSPDIGMNQIVALLVHNIEIALPPRVADLVEGRPHVDIDDQDSELVAVRSDDRRGNAQRRHVRLLEGAVFLIEVDRRGVELPGRQLDRGLEVVAVAFALQLRLGNGADGAARPHAVDPHQLAPAVGDADDPELGIFRLGAELGDEPRGDPFLEHVAGRPGHGIDIVGDPRPHDPFDRLALHADIGAGAGHRRLELQREQMGTGIKPVERPRQRVAASMLRWISVLTAAAVSTTRATITSIKRVDSLMAWPLEMAGF